MSGERILRLLIIVVALVTVLASVTAAEQALASDQRFAPRPAEAYAEFAPLREPRASVPVGALWVQGYGPHGSAAAPDNLETIRGLNGLTISRNLQLSLTLGLFDLLGIDPGLRNQVSARFSDLSIVRVRDLSRLDGPAGEPRIYEALKAGSVTISTERNLSLNLNGNAFSQVLPVEGRGSAGQARGTTLEARDMFIALRVVTPSRVRKYERELALGRDGGASATLDEYRVQVSAVELLGCLGAVTTAESAAECGQAHPMQVTLSRPSAGNREALASQSVAWKLGDPAVRLPLPVPLSDDAGGLLRELMVTPRIGFEEVRRGGTDRFRLSADTRVAVALQGDRLVSLRQPEGWEW